MEDDPVDRLWCFASPALVPLIPDINQRYRWARVCRNEEKRPNWSRLFSGDAFVLCESYGIYNGSFGHRGGTGGLPNRNELIQTYRKKHPEWKEAKIKRVVEESIAKASREADTIRGRVDPGEILSFLKALCAFGPVVLVLSDGGTMSPEIGGTYGLPDSARHPRFHDAYNIFLNELTIRDFIPLPYWIPIKVVPE